MKSFMDLLSEEVTPKVYDYRVNHEAKTVDIGFKSTTNSKETNWVTFSEGDLKRLGSTIAKASGEISFKSNLSNKDNNMK
jgi:hypothetical protein